MNRQKTHSSLLISIVCVWLLYLLWQCGRPQRFYASQDFINAHWASNQPFAGEIACNDSMGTYIAFLDVRLTPEYTMPYLSVLVSGPLSGRWVFPVNQKNKIDSGPMRDFRFALDSLTFIPLHPITEWQVRHDMSTETLKGVASIGLCIEYYGKR